MIIGSSPTSPCSPEPDHTIPFAGTAPSAAATYDLGFSEGPVYDTVASVEEEMRAGGSSTFVQAEAEVFPEPPAELHSFQDDEHVYMNKEDHLYMNSPEASSSYGGAVDQTPSPSNGIAYFVSLSSPSPGNSGAAFPFKN
jgi:hypothetical protein